MIFCDIYVINLWYKEIILEKIIKLRKDIDYMYYIYMFNVLNFYIIVNEVCVFKLFVDRFIVLLF